MKRIMLMTSLFIGQMPISYAVLHWSPQSMRISKAEPDTAYQVRMMKRKNVKATPIIYGKIVSAVDQQPLEIAVIKVSKKILHVSPAGTYQWEASPGTYTLLARDIGYIDVIAKKIRLAKGDSIELNFHLPPGPPIVHKMPK